MPSVPRKRNAPAVKSAKGSAPSATMVAVMLSLSQLSSSDLHLSPELEAARRSFVDGMKRDVLAPFFATSGWDIREVWDALLVAFKAKWYPLLVAVVSKLDVRRFDVARFSEGLAREIESAVNEELADHYLSSVRRTEMADRIAFRLKPLLAKIESGEKVSPEAHHLYGRLHHAAAGHLLAQLLLSEALDRREVDHVQYPVLKIGRMASIRSLALQRLMLVSDGIE